MDRTACRDVPVLTQGHCVVPMTVLAGGLRA